MQVAKALARLRKGTESSELPLLAHAIKQRRLCADAIKCAYILYATQ